MTHYIATTNAPSSYWNGWWDKVGIVVKHDRECYLLRSKRTGSDARYDGEILVARAASGRYWAQAAEQADD
jgi:hypothetical protein